MASIESTTKPGRGQVGPPRRPPAPSGTRPDPLCDSLVTVKQLAAEFGKSLSATYRLLARIRRVCGPLKPVSGKGEFYRPAVERRLMELSFSQEGMHAK